MPPRHESTFTIPLADFNVSLLPPHARVPGSPEFRSAVADLVRAECVGVGGSARVVVNDEAGTIQVTWRAGAGQPDPLTVAVSHLERGRRPEGVRLLEVLRFQRPGDVAVLYNLGMALSDAGRLDEAVRHLRSALGHAPGHANARVGLGVALARRGDTKDAIWNLREALSAEPDNPWAHRNIGACLLKEGDYEVAERHLRRAAELLPSDQQAAYGLGQALLALKREPEADEQFIRAIALDDRSEIAELAREERSRLAQSSFRGRGERPDAVMYLLGALERFEALPPEEMRKIGLEIAILGRGGLDTNDSTQKYTLRSLPGRFSGLHLVCLMYAAFKVVAPDQDIGFDLSREYETALAMHRRS